MTSRSWGLELWVRSDVTTLTVYLIDACRILCLSLFAIRHLW